MKILTTYRFDEADPNWATQIDEAFNRVLNFAPELQAPPLNATRREQKEGRHPTLISLRRLTNGEFCQEDWTALNKMAADIHDRVFARYGQIDEGDSEDLQAVAETCKQAALNVVLTMKDFSEWLQVHIQHDLVHSR